MIHHHLLNYQEKKNNSLEIDQKKLVKTFLYSDKDSWVEYFTGFLYIMKPDTQGKVHLEIRFYRHSHLAEVQPEIRYPLELHTDQIGVYTIIRQQVIKTIQKPEQNLLYLKIGSQNKIISISFNNKGYCQALLQHLTLVLQNNQQDQMTFNQQNIFFLSCSMKQNLIYVDSLFMLQQKINQFCNFFNKVDRKLYETHQQHLSYQQQNYMIQFFQIIKYMFLRRNKKIIKTFIENGYYFQTMLRCLSYNPFGVFYFDYLKVFKEKIVVDNHLNLQLQNDELIQLTKNYALIAKVKFLKDVAICTFIEISTEAVFNELVNQANKTVFQIITSQNSNLMQNLIVLSKKNQQKFLCVFTQIWQIFKQIAQDTQTAVLKQMFYFEWIYHCLFTETWAAIGRLIKKRQISAIHPRFWQKWMQSMNPMLSFQWQQSQKIILNHKESLKSQQKIDLMNILIHIMSGCDSNTKTLILQFVHVQIQLSQNRKKLSAKYATYIFNTFIKQSFEYCNNQNDIQNYLQFIQKIYIAQPVRTRHFLIESNLFKSLKGYLSNKFVFIMILKLFKTFIEVGDKDTFVYLDLTDFFDCLREKYTSNKINYNVISSLFLSIFKLFKSSTITQVKQYVQRIFFKTESKEDNLISAEEKKTLQDKKIQQEQRQTVNNFKRSVPVDGFEKEVDI